MICIVFVIIVLFYVNGLLYLGYLVGYIQVDIWVCVWWMSGGRIWFVCVDDIYGMLIMLVVEKVGVILEIFIVNIQVSYECDFVVFGVVFDYYDLINLLVNKVLIEQFYVKLEVVGYISCCLVVQFYDLVKGMFLFDCYVKGICLNCGSFDQYGDNCEVCGVIYVLIDLKELCLVIFGVMLEMCDLEYFFFEVGYFDVFLCEWLVGDVVLLGVKVKLGEWFNVEGGLCVWDILCDVLYFGFQIFGQLGKYFYVWLDVLIGYLFSFQILCGKFGEDFDVYLCVGIFIELYYFIGKDIVNFYGLFWLVVLYGIGYCVLICLYVNGYLIVDGVKMSKLCGIFVMVCIFFDVGLELEVLCYYYVVKFGGGVDDFDLNLGDFIVCVNVDLVGKFVNLVSCCVGFISKCFDGWLVVQLFDVVQYQCFVDGLVLICEVYECNDLVVVICLIMILVDEVNCYIDDVKLWVIVKQEGVDVQLQVVCSQGLNLFCVLVIVLKLVLLVIVVQVEVFLVVLVNDWIELVQLLFGYCIIEYILLFICIDLKKIDVMIDVFKDILQLVVVVVFGVKLVVLVLVKDDVKSVDVLVYIGIDDFVKFDLCIGKVLVCEFVEGLDKLLCFELDVGELGKCQIFFGICGSYGELEKLVGCSVVFIVNLVLCKMCFGLSEGMILLVGFDGGVLVLLDVDSGVQLGMLVC